MDFRKLLSFDFKHLPFIAFAFVVSLFVFLKAIFDIDVYYDTSWYHIPFAARIWHIVPKDVFIGEGIQFEPRYQGFPLLAEFLQGLFWKVTGRIQSTNLVSFLSILGYVLFLKKYFTVPMYLSITALFAIPVVLIHASSSMIDLFGNIGISLAVISLFGLLHTSKHAKAFMFYCWLGLTIAINTKLVLLPLATAIVIIGLFLLMYTQKIQVRIVKKYCIILMIAFCMMYAFPIKNTIIFKNPVYPIRVQIAGIVLPHTLTPEAYSQKNRQIAWLDSVFDLKSKYKWKMGLNDKDENVSYRGGFMGVYVICNLFLLLGIACYQRKKTLHNAYSSKAAIITVFLLSVIPMHFPQSFELRYFMSWMICLVSLNLILLSYIKNILSTYQGVISCAFAGFLVFTLFKVDNFYHTPQFIPVHGYIKQGINMEYVTSIPDNADVCLVVEHLWNVKEQNKKIPIKFSFFYSSFFHKNLDKTYSVTAVRDRKRCADDSYIIP